MNDSFMDDILKEMDFHAFGSGEFTASPTEVMNALNKTETVFLDVRTEEEHALCSYPFAQHVPLQQLPDALNTLPQNRLFIVFSSSAFEASVGSFYLRANNYDEVKTFVGGVDALTPLLKPSPLYLKGLG
ncbi:MAG: rhodanese-like domain-containing protein [Desulfovibrio sp.]